MDSNWQEFREACETIRRSLEDKYGEEFSGIGNALSHARAKKHPVAFRNKDELRVITDLRNMLSHQFHRSGSNIATPTNASVELAKKFARVFGEPPLIDRFMVRDPERCHPSQALHDISDTIITENISQIPVYADEEFCGLLTTNAIARWLALSLKKNAGELLEDSVTVGKILEYAEAYESPRFAHPKTEVSEIINEIQASDNLSHCVLITSTGHHSGRLMGIVTQFDLGTLYSALES